MGNGLVEGEEEIEKSALSTFRPNLPATILRFSMRLTDGFRRKRCWLDWKIVMMKTRRCGHSMVWRVEEWWDEEDKDERQLFVGAGENNYCCGSVRVWSMVWLAFQPVQEQ